MDVFEEVERLANATSEFKDELALYEDLLISSKRPASSSHEPTMLSPPQARARYILKLEGPLNTSEKIREAAGLNTLPQMLEGNGEDGDAQFCVVNGREKQAIERWLGGRGNGFMPMFASIRMAYKDFDGSSLYPTLGVDHTLPHHRTINNTFTFLPAQAQYPVWYFFYGTLADIPTLSHVLSVSEAEVPDLRPATVEGGLMKTWGDGKYNALVDGPMGACLEGSAYLVCSKEDEDALRRYETDNYEVVRCMILVDGKKEVMGCTFRFCGTVDVDEGTGVLKSSIPR